MSTPPETPASISSSQIPTAPAVPLAYESPPHARSDAWRVRLYILLAAGLLVFMALIANPVIFGWETFGWGILGTPIGPIESIEAGAFDDRIYYLLHAAGFLGLFLLSQWLFLLPRGRVRFQTTHHHRSRRTSVIAGAFIGMLLTTGLAASILELTHLWQDFLGAEWHVGSFLVRGFYACWAGMLLAWALWAGVFYWYYRDTDHQTMVARITRTLIAGTVLELLISVPAYVRSVQDPDNCYCAKGSYTGLVFGLTAVFWLFGPGVYLLLLRDKRRFTSKV